VLVLFAVHLIFGMIFLVTGILEFLKINTLDVSWIYMGSNLAIGTSIIILGILFAKNIFKPSQNSFFNVN
jgi:hypothetical protein